MCVALLGVTESEDRRSLIQDGMWPIKVLVIAGCCYGAFQLSTERLLDLVTVALIGACTCTLVQAMLLVDVAYEYAQWLVELYEETYSEVYKHLLIWITVGLNLFLAAGSVYLFLWYPSNSDRTIVAVNAFAAMLMTMLSSTEHVREINPQAGIFQGALLGSYSLYLIGSAIISKASNAGASTEGWLKTLSTLAFFFTMFFAAFSALRTGQASGKFLLKGAGGEEEEGEADEYNRSFFHVVFLLSCLQLALVMNRWRVPRVDLGAGVLEVVDTNVAYMVKVGTSWVIFGLYLWSLYAPSFFPERDFFQ